jgi:hypothetical protein
MFVMLMNREISSRQIAIRKIEVGEVALRLARIFTGLCSAEQLLVITNEHL